MALNSGDLNVNFWSRKFMKRKLLACLVNFISRMCCTHCPLSLISFIKDHWEFEKQLFRNDLKFIILKILTWKCHTFLTLWKKGHLTFETCLICKSSHFTNRNLSQVFSSSFCNDFWHEIHSTCPFEFFETPVSNRFFFRNFDYFVFVEIFLRTAFLIDDIFSNSFFWDILNTVRNLIAVRCSLKDTHF